MVDRLFHAHPALPYPTLPNRTVPPYVACARLVCLGGVIPCHRVPARYFECTSRPLCKAKRNAARNGAVVELIAAAAPAAVAEDKDKCGAGDGEHGDIDASGVLDDQPDPTGITRYVTFFAQV